MFVTAVFLLYYESLDIAPSVQIFIDHDATSS